RRVMWGMVERPEEGVGGLRLLGEGEWRQVVEEWNRTEAAIPGGGIHELFEEQVERTPEGVALIQGERRISYRELNQRANHLAHFLRSQHVTREVRVGIYLRRSIEQITAVLGVLKCGGAYVPLDPAYPEERLRYMIKTARISTVLTSNTSPQLTPEETE